MRSNLIVVYQIINQLPVKDFTVRHIFPVILHKLFLKTAVKPLNKGIGLGGCRIREVVSDSNLLEISVKLSQELQTIICFNGLNLEGRDDG